MTHEHDLERYAEVLVKVGLRTEPGDRLLIKAGLDAAPLVRLVTAHAYRAGAINVDVIWLDEAVKRSRFVDGPDAALDELPLDVVVQSKADERSDSFLYILTEDPDLLADVDPGHVARFQQNFSKALAGVSESMAALRTIWCIVAGPSPAWATNVFPDADVDEAVSLLWEAVFRTCRIDQPDPVAAWNEHLAGLTARCDFLNGRSYDRLRYEGPGTDLVVGLPEGHIWAGGPEGLRSSVPNLPTEEVFTAPHRERADGVIRATKPLSFLGTSIDDFEFQFEDGAVVSVRAGQGQAALDKLVEMDEGASRLGEVALVPQSSLVASQRLIWHNTLFDENDASHIAVGRAYPICIEGGREMALDDLTAAGLNHSNIHVDFVVGSDELNVYGVTKDGAEEPLLVAGEWAFDV